MVGSLSREATAVLLREVLTDALLLSREATTALLPRGVTDALLLSREEATTALSHIVIDAPPEGVGVVWPGSG